VSAGAAVDAGGGRGGAGRFGRKRSGKITRSHSPDYRQQVGRRRECGLRKARSEKQERRSVSYAT
jgi:hypothetical protein